MFLATEKYSASEIYSTKLKCIVLLRGYQLLKYGTYLVTY